MERMSEAKMDVSDTPREGGKCPQELPAELLVAVRSRVPFRLCQSCGDSIGAARLTLLPDALVCAWCAGASHHPMAIPAGSTFTGSLAAQAGATRRVKPPRH